MKINNPLDYTENHRFTVFRESSLSPLQLKSLHHLYLPMIGPESVALYMALHQQLPSEMSGYSPLVEQRKLFLALGVELSVQGRRRMIDCASRLEATGLLQTIQKVDPSSEETVYEYRLYMPLNPYEFFQNQHLTLLLRDRVGKPALLRLYDEFCAPEPEEAAAREWNELNVSVPFYELFRLSPQSVDEDLERLAHSAPAAAGAGAANMWEKENGFSYHDIILQFPRTSRNRAFVEGLQHKPHRLAELNFIAMKYKLTLQEICRLLDEDEVFSADGQLEYDVLQNKASLLFHQNRRREDYLRLKDMRFAGTEEAEEAAFGEEKPVPREFFVEVPAMLQDQCTAEQYNLFLRNRPYTDVLERFFPGKVPDRILQIFERIDLQYKLKEEVINVLIHYLKAENLSWSRPYIETIAADMLGRQIETWEQAVEYIRRQTELKRKAAQPQERGTSPSRQPGRKGPAGRSAGRGKPPIPVFTGEGQKVSEEEFARILREVTGKES
jgi:replication initiation and membrane attachment protein